MTDLETRTLVVEALHKTANVFNNPSVSGRLQDPAGHVLLEELQLDSLDMVEWGIELESRTGLLIDTAELNSAGTIADVVELLVRKFAERG